MNDLFIKTMKKLQENRKVENLKAIKENKHVDLEGEEKDIITVIDPDLSTKEFKEKQQEINDIIDKTPDGEDVVDTEYVGMKIYTCPLCLSNFYSEVEMNSKDQCPICYETPDKFVYIGTVEQAPNEDDEKAVKQAENELDKTDETSEESNEEPDEGEFVEENPETEEEPIEDEDGEQRLVSSKSINTKEKVMNEDLKPEDIEDIIDLTDINNKLNNAESIEDLKNIIIIIPNSALRELAQTALTNCTDRYNYDVPYVASKIQEALKANKNQVNKCKANKDQVNKCKANKDQKVLTEGGIYPVSLDEGAEEAFENKVGEILGGSVKVSNLELIPAKGFGGSGVYWFRATINVSNSDVIDKFINENTPTAKLLNDNNELIINSYSDISIEDDKYDSGITFDCPADCKLEFDMDDLDADADRVGDAIIQKLKENQETLINLLKEYEVDDIEESKKLKESDEENGIIELGNGFQTILDKDTNSYIVLYRGSEIDSSLKDDEYYEACKTLDGIKNFVKKLKIQTTGKGFAKKSRIVKESDESILRLAKNSIVNGKLPEEIKYKGKTYKQFYVIDPDNSGETSDIYYCNMENTPSGDPQESNDYFYLKVALNKTENGYKGIKEIRFAEDLTESKELKESPQQVPGTKIKRKNNEEKLDEGTDLKRIARYNEFDNGYVLFDYKKMTDEEAEQKAKEASEKDPYDVYYVEYDDVMNPRSDLSWINGISYNIDEYNFTRSKEKDENDKYPMIAKKDNTLWADDKDNLKESNNNHKIKIGSKVYWVGVGNEISAEGEVIDFPVDGRMTIKWDDNEQNTYDITDPNIILADNYDNSVNESEESPQQVPGTKIKRKNNEEKLDEAKLTDYLNQQELDRLIRQNPVLKNVMKSYKVLDNMILEVTTDMGISYYKAVLNDNGELELYWISKDGKKLGDPFLLSESRIEEVNNNCDDCWIMIEDCKKKLNEEAEAEGFKYNNKEYTGLDTYTYTFTLDQKDEFEKAKKELAKTGTVTKIFINNGYGLEYKKDKNI